MKTCLARRSGRIKSYFVGSNSSAAKTQLVNLSSLMSERVEPITTVPLSLRQGITFSSGSGGAR